MQPSNFALLRITRGVYSRAGNIQIILLSIQNFGQKPLFLFPGTMASEPGRLAEGQKGGNMKGTVLISIVNDILHC